MHLNLAELDEPALTAFIEKCENMISTKRRDILQAALSQRLSSIRLVLEDIYDPHNANAVIRTADAFGMQYIDVLENWNKFTISPGVTRGCIKWMTLTRYNRKGANNSQLCFEHLRQQDYKIYATSVHERSIPLESIDTSQKIAIVFGSERDGISGTAREYSDGLIQLPMRGFSESLNISVCAGIILYHLTNEARKHPLNFLAGIEKLRVYAEWLRKNIRAFAR